MRTPRRLLVPFDDSEPATAALDYASVLARRFDAKVFVFHALGEALAAPYVSEHATKTAMDELTAALRRREIPSIELVPMVRWTGALQGIHQVAAEIDADLVVMGTHGRTGLARALLGSVAEGVLRSSTLPVVTVRARQEAPSCVPARILVAIDLAVSSERALAYAVDFAALTGSALTVAHVITPPLLTGEDSPVMLAVVEDAVAGARAALEGVCSPHRARGVAIDSQLCQGDPALVIPVLASELGADLIVLGTHGRKGLTRALVGSVAEHILRSAAVPVMTLRSAA